MAQNNAEVMKRSMQRYLRLMLNSSDDSPELEQGFCVFVYSTAIKFAA
jgi:hypothetical protein